MSSDVQCKFDRNKIAATALAALFLCSASSLAAQGPPRYFASDGRVALDSALRDEDVQAALLYVNEHKSEMTELLSALAMRGAGTGSARARAELVARHMRENDLEDVTLEDGATPIVVGRIRGRARGAVLFVSTLDDAPGMAQGENAGTHGPRAGGDQILVPGSRALAPTAAMLAAAAALHEEGVRPARDLLFAAIPSGEAGLEAMKRLYSRLRDSVVAVVEVEGDGASIACTPEGETPGASESSLVAASVAIVKWFGMAPKMSDATSANARVAFASGTPAIVLGRKLDDADGAPDDSADLQTMVRSAKHVVLLAATLR